MVRKADTLAANTHEAFRLLDAAEAGSAAE